MKMNLFENLPNGSNYQFSRWSTTISRPHSSLPSKDVIEDMFKLGIDNRNQIQRPESASAKRIIQHHIHIPTGSRLVSPRPLIQPPTSPNRNTKPDHPSSKPINPRHYRSIPVRIKSTALTIPISKTKEEIFLPNFPKQTHEQRKITGERKRRRQQAQILADKYAETDTWFQLKQSLSELKRLATSQEILIDPNTSFFNYDGHSFTTLKQTVNEEDKKAAMFKSESGDSNFSFDIDMSSSFGSGFTSHELNRASLITSQSSFSRPRTAKRSIEPCPRFIFEPLVVASKPIHRFLLTGNHHPSSKSRLKPPPSPLYRSRPTTTPLSEEKRARLLVSDLSNDDNPSISKTPTPPMVRIDREIIPRKTLTPSPTHLIAPSSIQFTSTIKLKPQTPRCRSATDIKSPYLTNKHYPRFILIADQEHRIESWYHQYPFIHSDDLLTSFQSKQKPTISAFFIDDLQSSNSNISAKTFLQGKPFHINNDWKKYDLIFISNNIYEDIIIYLQTIINLIKSSGKIIQIYQINHEEDLKKQVKNICRQLQQQNIQ